MYPSSKGTHESFQGENILARASSKQFDAADMQLCTLARKTARIQHKSSNFVDFHTFFLDEREKFHA